MAAVRVLNQLRFQMPSVALVWADGGYVGWMVGYAHRVLKLTVEGDRSANQSPVDPAEPVVQHVEQRQRSALAEVHDADGESRPLLPVRSPPGVLVHTQAVTPG